MTTLLTVALAIVTSVVATLAVVAPLTANKVDDKLLEIGKMVEDALSKLAPAVK